MPLAHNWLLLILTSAVHIGCKYLIAKVKSLVEKENPSAQNYNANSLNYSISTVNKIASSDLNLKKAKKYDVHRLSNRHIYEHKTHCSN